MARKVVSMARRIEHGAEGRHAGREGWTHRVTVKAAAIAVAGTLLVGTGAYAAVSNADFFRSAFGDKGHEDIERQEVSYAEIAPEISEKADSTFVRPAMVWGEVDEAQADRLLGGYVQDVWQSVTVLGYTLTIDQLLVDANGLGLATYSLACPDGVAAQASGYGQYYLSSDTPVGDIYLEGADEDRQVSASDGTTVWLGSPFCIHGVMDVEATTPTDLHAGGVLRSVRRRAAAERPRVQAEGAQGGRGGSVHRLPAHGDCPDNRVCLHRRLGLNGERLFAWPSAAHPGGAR